MPKNYGPQGYWQACPQTIHGDGPPESLQTGARNGLQHFSANHVQPHRIQYYLERRDPEFDTKMVQVLHVYREVEIWREKGEHSPDLVAWVSYDEKPGIQAIQNTAPDLHLYLANMPSIGRDHEYIRHGTVSLLAGIDLLSGEVLGLVRKRHRSAEFIEFLQLADAHYPAGARIVSCSTTTPHTSHAKHAFS